MVFVAATTLVALLKHETDSAGPEAASTAAVEAGGGEELELGVAETYSMLWKIITLPLMPYYIAMLLTQKVGRPLILLLIHAFNFHSHKS